MTGYGNGTAATKEFAHSSQAPDLKWHGKSSAQRGKREPFNLEVLATSRCPGSSQEKLPTMSGGHRVHLDKPSDYTRKGVA